MIGRRRKFFNIDRLQTLQKAYKRYFLKRKSDTNNVLNFNVKT